MGSIDDIYIGVKLSHATLKVLIDEADVRNCSVENLISELINSRYPILTGQADPNEDNFL